MDGNKVTADNVILIGFMATGKTAVGEVLALRLKRRLLDTDHLVELMTGLSVSEIFQRFGEACFRDLESVAALALRRYRPGSLVVATGGGIIMRAANRIALRREGVVVLLTASPRAILRRTAKSGGRPLLEGPNPQSKVKTLLAGRARYYEDHDIQVDTTGITPGQAAAEIMRRLEERWS